MDAHTNAHTHTHLLSCSRLSFEDGLGSLVVLVGHGAGKGCHALTVTQIETDVWMRDEQLDDDGVLVADGHVHRRPALRVLRAHTHTHTEVTEQQRKRKETDFRWAFDNYI